MKKQYSSLRFAFTLIELLVVMGIIVLMGALVVPAVSGTLKGSSLTQAAQTLQGQFNNAQQQALAKGVTIELRLFACSDPDSTSADKDSSDSFKVRGLQCYAIQPNMDPTTVAQYKLKYTPITKLEFLPTTVIIDRLKPSDNNSSNQGTELSASLSTLCDPTRVRNKATQEDYQHPKLPRLGLNYQYYPIQFRADGTTDLDYNKSWYVTMHDLTKGDNLTIPPPNFFTLALDPVQGTTRTFRPM